MVWRYVLSRVGRISIAGLLGAIAIWVGTRLVLQGQFTMAGILVFGAAGILYVYTSDRAYPMRYLVPGLIFLIMMVVFPIGYTVYVSFTNMSTGHILPKQQAVAQIESRMYTPPNAPRYSYLAFKDAQGDLVLLFMGESGDKLYYENKLTPVQLPDSRFVDEDGDGTPDKFLDYTRMTIPQIVKDLPYLEHLAIPDGEYQLRMAGLREFTLYAPRYSYDPEHDTFTDLQTGTVYYSKEGFFTAPDGKVLYPGFPVRVGFRNYWSILANPAVSGPFGRVFLWTVLFAGLSVLTTFVLGLAIALLLNDPYLKFRRLYRVLVIVPYTIPAVISILVWRGLLNTNLGIVNHILMQLFHFKVPWFDDPMWAKAAIVMVNLWLGYPYMMIVSLGALQSIPGELYEAALVDGATWRQRFTKITLPLLLIPLAPLLIGSFAFNFNNFNLIYLLTGGGPPIPGSQTPAGATDILLSYAYNLAFKGGSGNQFGLAAAVSVIIFIIIATISAVNFRLTGALEDLSKNV